MAINLDELINRAISMASQVGNVKRKQQWDMAREQQDSDMARTQLMETGAMERTKITDIGATARQRLGDQSKMDITNIEQGGLNTRMGREHGQRDRELESTQGFNRETLNRTQSFSEQEAEKVRRANIHQTVLKSTLGSKEDGLPGQSDDGYKTKIANIALRGIGQKPFPLPTDSNEGLTPEQIEKRKKRLLEMQSIGK